MLALLTLLFFFFSKGPQRTVQFNNFYQPITNLTIYQRRVNYMGIKIVNNLPPYIKNISNNVRKFEICLKQFLHIHSFYHKLIMCH
jgi:plasmid replication initiation protein